MTVNSGRPENYYSPTGTYSSEVAHAQLQREHRRQQRHGAVGAMDQAPGQLDFITINSYVLNLLLGTWIFEILKICAGDYCEPSQSAPESARRPIEACEVLELSSDTQTAVQRLQKRDGKDDYPPLIIFLSALMVLVSRLTGDDSIAVGTSNGNGAAFVLSTPVELKEAFVNLLARVNEVA